MSTKSSIYIVSLLVLVVFLLGAVVWGGRPDLTDAERERARIENEARARKLEIDIQHKAVMSKWLEVGKVVGGTLVLLSIAGVVFVMLRWADRRSAEIRPDNAGLYPVIRIGDSGMKMLADPNRMARPVVMYGPAHLADRVTVHAIPTSEPVEQALTTARAQAVQLTAAANRHPRVYTGAPPAAPSSGALPPGDPAEPPAFSWPARVPLTALLNGQGASLDHLILGVTLDPATGQTSVVQAPMSRLIHIGVGGSSGWGKSICVQALAYQFVTARELPDLAMIDLQRTALKPFENSNRLLYPVAITERDAAATLRALRQELDRRLELFDAVPGALDLVSYNRLACDRLRPLICVADECTALLNDADALTALEALALRGRGPGLWLLLAGQHWTTKSVPSKVRDQLSTRIQFKSLSKSQSRVLLERSDAESLNVQGRALAILPGQDMVEIQAPWVSYSDIVAAATGDGPRHSLPTSDDVGQDELIRQLAAEGLSKRAIQERVFGYAGGAAYSAVSQVLDGE